MSETWLTEVESVAIVGMAGRFPQAADLDAFWQNIARGRDNVRRFTESELEAAGVPSTVRQDPSFVAARATIDDPEYFDAEFFKVNPKEAENTDPQHRLFLECCWQALEDAGLDPRRASGLIGVYAGADVNAYAVTNLLLGADGLQTLIGNDKDYLATRVAYKLNLKGPAISVQTACSTSLVAVHLAAQGLLSFQCDVALAGGVGVCLPSVGGYLYQEGGILSPDGRCRPFDAAARGTVGGDGVGVVVLKRTSEALRDRDRILAILRGSAINNDGDAKVGFTAPSVEGQSEVIAMAQAVAGVHPDSIGYLEAHGTGTPLGDPIEVNALTQVFRAKTARRGYCALGSLKGNVGHMNSAAGVGSLIKAVLALRHRTLPPIAHFEAPNPLLDLAESPFFAPRQAQPWPQGPEPRRAGVSSFGIGGTNVHVVLEEAPEPEPPPEARPVQALVLSARSRTALDAARRRLADRLEARLELDLADVAWTLQAGRAVFERRAVIVAASREEAIAGLRGAATLEALHEPTPRQAAFLLPGQGTQHAGMARDLYADEPVFAEALDEVLAHLDPLVGPELRRALLAADEDQEAESALAETRLTQPALFAFGYALARLWAHLGVQPAALLGHSVGELLAAALAGVLDLPDAARIVAARARHIAAQPRGVMLALPLPEELVSRLPDVVVAAVNGPRSTVVAGTEQAIAAVEALLGAQGVTGRRLRTSHAFHSPLVEGACDLLRAELERVRLRAPKIPFLSNVSGTWITDAEATSPQYWAGQLRATVRFHAGLIELGRRPGLALLQVGPGDALLRLAEQAGPSVAGLPRVPTCPRGGSGVSAARALAAAVGGLWAADVVLDLEAVFRGRRQPVSLPPYPFERARFWSDPKARLEAIYARQPFFGKRDDIQSWLYQPTWRRAPRAAHGDAPDGPTLIFTGEAGRSRALTEAIRARCPDLVLVTRGAAFREEPGRFTVNPADPGDLDRLLRALPRAPRLVVHLTELDAPVGDPARMDAFYEIAALIRALGRQGSPTRLALLGAGLADVTGAESLRPERAALTGLALCASQEYGRLDVRVLDVGADAGLGPVVDEVLSPRPRGLIAFRGATAWQPEQEPLIVPEAARSRLSEGATVLITGGLGGIGLYAAEHLAQRYKARLVLTGRTALPERSGWRAWLDSHDEHNRISARIRKVQAMEEAGAQVLCFAADAADEGQMRAVLRAAEARFGRVHAIIHAAGHVGDGLLTPLPELSRDRAELHFHGKVRGLLNLSRLAPPDLELFVVTSSLASLLGGIGGAAYAAANAFVDAFCRQQALAGRPFLAINWDAWVPHEGSTEARGPRPAWARFAIEPHQGVAALDTLLRAPGASQAAVSTIDLKLRLEALTRGGQDEGKKEAASAEKSTRHQRPAQNNEYVAPRDPLESELAEIWQALLGIHQVGVHDNFFRLGGDSLVAIQLSSRIRDAYGVELPVNQLFDEPTIAALAERVRARQGTAAPATETPPVAPAPPPAPNVIVEDRWFNLGPGVFPEKASVADLYNTVTRQLNASEFGEHSVFLNWGYVPNQEPSFAAVTLPERTLNRNPKRLVLELIGDVPVGPSDDVLDVACGRGGTVSVFRDLFSPGTVTGLDLSPEAVAFCQRRHTYPNTRFVVGDSESLPFEDGSRSIVTNLESSHCYPNIRQFYAEVFRVLRPGGHFCYSDMLHTARLPELEAALLELGFELVRVRDITANVLLSCDDIAANHARIFQGNNSEVYGNFLAVPGSRIYNEMRAGEQRYVIYTLRKPPAPRPPPPQEPPPPRDPPPPPPGQDGSAQAPSLLLRRGGERSPLFLVAPVFGSAFPYHLLASHTAPGRPIIGLQSTFTSREAEAPTIEAIAAAHLQEVRRHAPRGPYLLVGYSFGGWAAFEMSRQLLRDGEKVAFLGIIGTPPPVSMTAPLFAQAMAWQADIALAHARLARDTGLSEAQRAATAAGTPLQQSAHLNNLAALRYLPSPIEQRLELFVTMDNLAASPTDRTLGWWLLTTRSIEVSLHEGHHLNCLEEPQVRDLARRLDARLEEAERSQTV